MSDRTDADFLNDIREALARIADYLQTIDYESFRKDTKTQDAVIRNLEVAGEAAKGVSAELREQCPQIPWRGLTGIRDRLIHHYFGVNLDIVWQVITAELPAIVPLLNQVIEETESRGG